MNADGSQKWHAIPDTFTWKGANPGNIICGACYVSMHRSLKDPTKAAEFSEAELRCDDENFVPQGCKEHGAQSTNSNPCGIFLETSAVHNPDLELACPHDLALSSAQDVFSISADTYGKR